jgi:hypothetical protein
MGLLGWIEGCSAAEASAPAEPPPALPPGGGGRTPYPAYQVVEADKWAHDWDEKNRRLVLDRIRNVPRRSFFTEDEFALLEAMCDRLLPQDDRPVEQRIPIAPYIDARLATGGGNGYRYEEMPWDDETYRRGLAGVDQTSQAMFGAGGFRRLDGPRQDQVLTAIERRPAWRDLARAGRRALFQDPDARHDGDVLLAPDRMERDRLPGTCLAARPCPALAGQA